MRTALADYLGIKRSHMFQSTTPLDLTFVSQLQDYLRSSGISGTLFYARRVPQPSPGAGPEAQHHRPDPREGRAALPIPLRAMCPFLQLLHEGQPGRAGGVHQDDPHRGWPPTRQAVEHLVEPPKTAREVTVLH